MNLDDALREVLACPGCGGALHRTDDVVRCAGCAAEYPVRDNILDFLSPLDHKTDP